MKQMLTLLVLLILSSSVGLSQATVTAVSPANNAIHVSPATAIQVTFSEAMLTSSFNDMTSFIVLGMTSGRHLGTFGFSGGNTIATFTPTVPFKSGEIVLVDISSNLQNAGSVPITPFVYSFTVGVSSSPGTFATAIDYPTAANPRSVFISDLDGDGDGDMAVASQTTNSVSILKNNGDGTFATKVDYATGSTSYSVFISDVDGDGDGDVAVANLGSNNVSILKNNGDATFALSVDYATATQPISVSIGDVDGDSDGDLAVANLGSSNVSILKNNGDGTFAAKVDYSTGTQPTSVVISDIDGDGDGDIVLVNISSNTVSVLKNNGDGSFATKVDYATETHPYSAFASDIDGDGDNDIAAANLDGNNVSILKNNGDGTYAAKVNYPAGMGTVSVVIGDVDGDGDGDLAAVNFYSGTVSVLKNNGDGTFAANVDYATGSNPYSVLISDVDGDGIGDIAVANFSSSSASILKGNASPTNPAVTGLANPSTVTTGYATLLTATVTPGTNPTSTGLTVTGDLSSIGGSPTQQFYDDLTNGDVTAGDNIFSFSATVAPATTAGLKNLPLTVNDTQARSGNGSISLTVVLPTMVFSVLPVINDLNVSPSTTIQVTFTSEIQPSSFSALTSFIVSGSTSGRHLGTFGFSGGNTVVTFTPTIPFKQGELVFVDISGSLLNVSSVPVVPFVYSFTVSAAAAPATFLPKVDYQVGVQPRSVFVHDMDNDGDGDLAVANGGSSTVSILKNNGDGTFLAKVDYATGGYSTSVFVADVDGDGDGDLAVGNAYADYVVSVLTNNGDGTFAAKTDYPIGQSSNDVFVYDIDGDGFGDLIAVNGGSNTVSVLKNNGNGTFQPKIDYGTGAGPNYLFVSDVDNDGDGDILAGNQGSSTLSVLKNNGDGTFAVKVDYPTGAGELGSVAVCDLDADGDGDIVVSNQTYNLISVLKNNGDGTFTVNVDYPTGNGPTQVSVGDLDGDGDMDVAVPNAGFPSTVSVLKNNGDGTFAIKTDYPAGQSAQSIYISDLDGDGDGDIVVADYSLGNVSFLENDYIYYNLTVNIAGSGTVTKSPDQPSYLDGSTVQLDAIPALGYQFYEWSGDASGSLNPINVVMDNNKDVTATFVIDPFYETSYRTATYSDWATAVDAKGKYKAVKRKSDKVHLKFNIGAPANATGFTLKFTMDVSGAVTIGKTKEIQLGDSILNTNTATFTALTIVQGDTFQFDGYGLKGKIAGVKVVWQTSPKPTTQTMSNFKINTPKLPMPNLHNVGSELFPGGYGQAGAYFMSGLLVGIPQGVKGANSVIHPKYKDVQKSLVKFSHGIPQLHADSIRCLDTLPLNHKPISKQLKSMPPDKYSNKLFAELLTLKLNVAASITEKFPAGLGELTFFDKSEPTNPFNGQLISMIIQKADTMISCLPLTSKSPVPTTDDLYGVLQKINGAFAGVIDTISFAPKTKLTGVTQLINVPYLRKTPGVEPIIVFSGNVTEQVPEISGLQQNYPNPFNPITTIGVELSAASTISLKIYNLLGQEVAEVIRDETIDEGMYEFEFNADNLPSGVYLYRLTGQSVDDEGAVTSLNEMKKMILIR